MKAMVLSELYDIRENPNPLSLEHPAVPEPGPNDVLLEVLQVLTCREREPVQRIQGYRKRCRWGIWDVTRAIHSRGPETSKFLARGGMKVFSPVKHSIRPFVEAHPLK